MLDYRMESAGVCGIIYFPLATVCFKNEFGTLTEKNLLPKREQILSCKCDFKSVD